MENSYDYILDLEQRLAIFQLLEACNAADIRWDLAIIMLPKTSPMGLLSL
jgi:hypothetical protein